MTNSSPEPARTAENREHRSGIPQLELLQAVLDRVGIERYDVLIIGDGSGTGWQSPAGWCGILVDRLGAQRELFYGGLNKGSINLAEAMPFLQALSWFHATCGDDRLRSLGHVKVDVLTDSAVVAQWGNTAANPTLPLPTNAGVWSMAREFGRMGYQFRFHWIARATNQLHRLADVIASMARKSVMGHDVEQVRQIMESFTLGNPELPAELELDNLNPLTPR